MFTSRINNRIIIRNALIAIKIKIIKITSDHQPGYVECTFYDAFNKKHIVQEKLPIVTEKHLDAESNYPQDGIIAGEIIKESRNLKGDNIVTIDTSRPWGIDTIEGQSQFDVLEKQIIETGR